MTDDIRRLIGSYATGSLTEAERKTLFEAALEDQELFDELAREHSFKELLEEPGAKQRLIAALSKPETKSQAPFFARPWRWASAVMVAGSVFLAVIAGRVVLRPPSQPPVEMARMTAAAPPRAPERVPEPLSPPPPEASAPAPPAAPVAVSPQAKRAPIVPAEKTPSEKMLNASNVVEVQKAQVENDSAQKDVRRDEPAAAGGQVAAPPTAIGSLGAQSAASGAGGAAPPRPASASFRAALMKPGRFAFDYAVEPGGILMVKSAAVGFLRVVSTTATAQQTIFPAAGTGRVSVDSVNRVQIPPGTTELVVTVSVQPDTASVHGLKTTSDTVTGTVEDPNPSVVSKLVLVLRVHY